MTFSWTDQPSPLVRKKSPAPQPRHAKPKSTPRLLRKFGELVTREIWSKDDPKHRVDWQDPQVWEKIQREGRFCRADELMTSCGTVTIHQAESEEPKVLVVYNKNIGIFQLPKGRKDFNEGHLKAALRETAEETGVAVQPLRLRFGSRATPPKAAGKRGLDIEVAEDKRLGISEGLSNEVIGVSEYPDPATGAWRNIHWYAAKPQDGIERDDKRMSKQDKEKFSTFWFTEEEALAHLKLDDERYMVRVVFAYVQAMSTEDWESNRRREKLGFSMDTVADS